MSLRERVYDNLVKRRNRILEGKINCIPSSFTRFKAEMKKFLKWNMALDEKISATIEKMDNYIAHQKEYIKTF